MKRALRIVICSVLVCVFIGIAALEYVTYQAERSGDLASDTVLVIASGSGVKAIAQQLAQQDVISSETIFLAYSYLRQHHRSLKAGEYRFTKGISMVEVIKILESGRSITYPVTIAEGLTSREILSLIDKEPVLTGNSSAENSAVDEGNFLPETYHVTRGTTRDALMKRMQTAMQRTLDAAWNTRQEGLPLTSPAEALILASIIEKETGVADERSRVAAVFINRLRRGMPLQSDPTANYGLYLETGAMKKRLRRNDIKHVSAYNTYVIPALPPTPICNPGKASIEAALNPLKTNELYFAADGKGGHVFAETLQEHQRNVVAYHRMLRAAD